MDGDNRDKQPWQYIISWTVVSVLAKVGCLTFGVAALAIFGGLWVDTQLGTRPWITAALMVLSVPIVTWLIVKITRSGTASLASTTAAKTKNNEEETNRGRNPKA
jgi:hypothetical protein